MFEEKRNFSPIIVIQDKKGGLKVRFPIQIVTWAAMAKEAEAPVVTQFSSYKCEPISQFSLEQSLNTQQSTATRHVLHRRQSIRFIEHIYINSAAHNEHRERAGKMSC